MVQDRYTEHIRIVYNDYFVFSQEDAYKFIEKENDNKLCININGHYDVSKNMALYILKYIYNEIENGRTEGSLRDYLSSSIFIDRTKEERLKEFFKEWRDGIRSSAVKETVDQLEQTDITDLPFVQESMNKLVSMGYLTKEKADSMIVCWSGHTTADPLYNILFLNYNLNKSLSHKPLINYSLYTAYKVYQEKQNILHGLRYTTGIDYDFPDKKYLDRIYGRIPSCI